MKTLHLRKPPKDQREKLVLLSMVELYLQTGKPIGSNTLKESAFGDLSSATIRNYFAKLEEQGYLKQQHSSGGRIPTHIAYQLYAETHLNSPLLDDKEKKELQKILYQETREVASYLQYAAEELSKITNCAVFLSAPRFDQDFILDVKFVGVDNHRCLCVLITDFGLVQTEILYSDLKLSTFTLKRLEGFFRWRLSGGDKPKLTPHEEVLATRFYGEVMLRHLVGTTNFSVEDLYKTGFSQLLAYADFNDSTALASGLGLFENKEALRSLLSECANTKALSVWIGGNLQACSAIAIPYKIHNTVVGAIAILGPNRIPYRKLFGVLQTASDAISDALTKTMYKFKISVRTPAPLAIESNKRETSLLFGDGLWKKIKKRP